VFGLVRVLIGHKLIACGRLCDLHKINAHALLPQQYQIARGTGSTRIHSEITGIMQPLVSACLRVHSLATLTVIFACPSYHYGHFVVADLLAEVTSTSTASCLAHHTCRYSYFAPSHDHLVLSVDPYHLRGYLAHHHPSYDLDRNRDLSRFFRLPGRAQDHHPRFWYHQP